MANNLSIVRDDFFDAIIGDESEEGPVVVEEVASDDVISVEDAANEVKELVEAAVDFIEQEMIPQWERAEQFMSGESDVKKVSGRSQVTDTVMRDAVRTLKPNLMRVFCQAERIVAYESPDKANYVMSAISEQQTIFNNTLFWENGGYEVLLSSVHDTLVNKNAIVKTVRREGYRQDFVVIAPCTDMELQNMQAMDDVKILSVEQMGEDMAPDGSVTALLRVEAVLLRKAGETVMAAVDLLNFFVSEEATTPDNAKVIGERRSISVSEARELGLEYDDWLELDDYDSETDRGSTLSASRRGYSKKNATKKQSETADPAKHSFLLTEAYAQFDLLGTGMTQTYRFWLGGTNYVYLAHERVEEQPYSSIMCDPVPGSFFGRSMYDVLAESQNTQTSLLRATCDNAHASNNTRLAIHEQMVNMHDVLNPVLGAPIRVRAPGMIQPISTESSIGAMLPLLQHLQQKSENKAGVTNASMGLDPDAMQSTNKEAVMNTIQLALGQVELMCRNMAESGLKSVFKKLLKLSLRHETAKQYIDVMGSAVPVDAALFDPNSKMTTSVGIGTGNQMQRGQFLTMMLERQEKVIADFGVNNPICTVQQMFRTLSDLGAMAGVSNLSRYMTPIDPQTAQALQAQMEQKAAASQPEPPSQGIIAAETVRAQSRIKEKELDANQRNMENDRDTRIKMTTALLDDDFRRDQLAQQRELESAKLEGRRVEQEAIQREQNAQRQYQRETQMIDQAHNQENAAMQQRALALTKLIDEAVRERQQLQQQMQPQQAQQGQPAAPQQQPQGQ